MPRSPVAKTAKAGACKAPIAGSTPAGASTSRDSPLLTAEELGRILGEEFDRDGWGKIEPDYFSDPGLGDGTEYEGLRAVLERAAKVINERFMDKLRAATERMEET